MVRAQLICLLVAATLMSMVTSARIHHHKNAPIDDQHVRWVDLLEKRDIGKMGYGWNDCEFSPMSCLLRRRRSLPLRSFEVEMN
ncbi:unnamed protein product, partial [Mesorhabditis spiculigera]